MHKVKEWAREHRDAIVITIGLVLVMAWYIFSAWFSFPGRV
jgi:hypothetical protein